MKVLCKDCWIAHELSTLLASCKCCHENTQIDRLEPLATKTRSMDAKPLVCKLHPAEPLDVYCGTCNGEVSPRAVVGENSVSAFVGDTQSGKTSLLWVLSERLRQANDSGVFIRQALGDSDEQMAEAVKSIFESGRISRTQPTDADVRNYAWELVTGPQTTTVVAFHDAAGEIWTNLARLSRSAYDCFYRYLDLAGSIVFAIDGARLIESVETTEQGGVSSPQARAAQLHEISIIDAVARRIKARDERNRTCPVAAVVTKADMLWGDPRWKLFKGDSGASAEAIDAAVRELLVAAGRQALMTAIEETFTPVRYFAVSAFGSAPLQPLRLEALRPARVAEPLLALLHNRASQA